MEKLLKVVKSRFFISAFVILLELVQLFIVFGLFYKYSSLVVVLGYIFFFVVLEGKKY